MKRIVWATVLLLGLSLSLQVLRRGSAQPSKTPLRRLITLSPNLTELTFRLGAGDQVVGVSNYCNYPEDARRSTKVGDLLNPSLERILDLQPDLILLENWSSSKIAQRLSNLGLNVHETISPASIRDISTLVRDVGAAIGRRKEAENVVVDMEARLQELRRRSLGLAIHPRIYVEIDPPSWTVGSRSFTSEALALAGGRNLFGDIDKPSFEASRESIVVRNPDLILSFSASAEDIRRRPGWDRIVAVRDRRIVDDFNRDLLSRGSHRIVEGIEDLQSRLIRIYANGHKTPTTQP